MAVFIDSSMIIAFLHRRDQNHAAASSILPGLLRGERGPAFITDYIVDEVLTFLVAREVARTALDKAIAFLLGDGQDPSDLVLHKVDADDFAEALRLVRRHRTRKLSFTDCTILSVLSTRGIQVIASFDKGFDGLIERIGPSG